MFERLRRFFRRRPGMVGIPPSARQVPADAGLHALDFSCRYADSINYHVENRMMELGIQPEEIGWEDTVRRIPCAGFHPHGTEGGNNSPDGRLIVDSGLFNFDFLRVDYGDEVAALYAQSRLRDRLDAIIAHEYEESRRGESHVDALKLAPYTALRIGDRARAILAAMEKGWKWP